MLVERHVSVEMRMKGPLPCRELRKVMLDAQRTSEMNCRERRECRVIEDRMAC